MSPTTATATAAAAVRAAAAASPGSRPAGSDPSARRRPARRVKVGIVLAFTGHYASVRLLARFLELAGLEVVKSRVTTPKVIEAGTTFTSADFCIPLRVYVGHVHHLLQEHPDLDAVVAPNLLTEDGISSTCSKYRDVGGVAIRSLGDTVGYLLTRDPMRDGGRRDGAERLARLAGSDTVAARLERGRGLPAFVMPNIRSLDRLEMRNVCYDVYADLLGWPKARKAALLLPPKARFALDPELRRLEEAFAAAYREVVEGQAGRLAALLADEGKPRLGLVGRRYLINDPALTCDLKNWFQKKGVCVLTAADVPPAELRPGYEAVDGYYDTHKEGQAFIDWAVDRVDGFISLGSFGCHPDAFQIDFLAEYARSLGAPCWTFRFDESAGGAGFQTRYETILAFLEARRDRRLARGRAATGGAAGATAPPDEAAPGFPAEPGVAPQETGAAGNVIPLTVIHKRVSGRPCHLSEDERTVAAAAPGRARPQKPLIVWPYMGEILNLLVEEACHQLGLADYACPPEPLAEEAMLLGNDRYTESCSPYACSTGTLKQSLSRALDRLEEEAAREGRPVEPRRILMLMARGEGPCTFGWYAIVQNRHIPEEFRDRLAAHGHTIEMATMGLDGFVDFVRDLCRIGNAERLKPILDFVEAWEKGLHRLPWFTRTRLRLRLFQAIGRLTAPLWAKLDAAEDLRARSLILRAHELQPGAVAAAYRQAVELLRRAHDRDAIAAAHRRGIALLEAVPRDDKVKPRVVAVGEIYVALTSFGNRGAIENLLAREGVEVVEGVTLGGFIRNSLREMKRRSWRNKPWLRPLLDLLRRADLYLLEQRVREPEARPFLVHEVGGDGLPTVGHARHYVEEGCDGVIHVYPFKCMPEGIAKDAVKELADLYGVRYLPLSFDKETEVERLRTEIGTFATLLHAEVARRGGDDPARYWEWKRHEVARRRELGRTLTELYDAYRRPRHAD